MLIFLHLVSLLFLSQKCFSTYIVKKQFGLNQNKYCFIITLFLALLQTIPNFSKEKPKFWWSFREYFMAYFCFPKLSKPKEVLFIHLWVQNAVFETHQISAGVWYLWISHQFWSGFEEIYYHNLDVSLVDEFWPWVSRELQPTALILCSSAHELCTVGKLE